MGSGHSAGCGGCCTWAGTLTSQAEPLVGNLKAIKVPNSIREVKNRVFFAAVHVAKMAYGLLPTRPSPIDICRRTFAYFDFC